MPTTYTSFGHLILLDVTFNGTEGQPGSSLIWGRFLRSNSDIDIIDVDEDGRLDIGTDSFELASLPGDELFSGYTITSGGVEYGIFSNGTNYYVPLPVNGIGQTIIPDSGTSNALQTETSGAAFLCFLGGTMIATPGGERPVESLAIGDAVLTADSRAVPVRWIGRQHVTRPVNMTQSQALAPVRIAAGALGNHSDLYVSADHGMIVDGCVINASALVNGGSVRFVPATDLPATFTYYHVETDAHDEILANGARTETFIDAAGRAAFDNYGEYLALYGTVRIIPEMRMPRITSARMLPVSVRTRLAGETAGTPSDTRPQTTVA